jgi:hypothetical protein
VAIEKRFAPWYETKRIVLSALDDQALLAWYAKRGFEKVGATYVEPGYGSVVPMLKRLG